MAVTGYLTRVATGRTITESGGLPWIEGDLGISGGGGSGTVTVRGATQYTDQGTSGNRNLSLPSGTVAGDGALLLYFNAASTNTWTGAPTGWTEVCRDSFTSHGQIAAATKDAAISSTDISNGYVTVNIPASFNSIAVVLITYAGADATVMDVTPVTRAATSDYNNPSVLDIPAITTVTDNAAVIIGATCRKASPTWSAKPADTELVAGGSSDPSNWWVGYSAVSPAGTHAATSVSVNNVEYELTLALAIRPAPSGDSDTGSGSDSQSLSAALSGAETATGTDAGTVAAATSQTDTGSGTDAGTVAVAVPGSDTATGTDAASTTATLSGSETSGGTDANSIAVALSGTETGTGTDAGSVTVPTSGGSDPGSGTEGFTLVVTISATDTGSGADANSIAAAIGATETGSGSESSSLEAVGGEETIDGGLDISYSDDQVTDRGIGMQEAATGVEGDPEIVYVVRAVSDGDTAQGYDMANPNYRPGGGTLLSEGTRDLGRSSLSGVE